MIFEMCGIRSGAFGNYWGMRASAGLMRMYELQKVVAALLRDASALFTLRVRMRKSLNCLGWAYLSNPG